MIIIKISPRNRKFIIFHFSGKAFKVISYARNAVFHHKTSDLLGSPIIDLKNVSCMSTVKSVTKA